MEDKTQTLASGVIIPVLQAVISGVLFGLLVLTGWALRDHVTGWRVLFFGLALGAFVSWVWAVRKWHNWGDALFGVPLPSSPEPSKEPFRVEVVAEDPEGAYKRGAYLDTTIPEEALKRACRVIAAGGDFSYASLSGPHKPLSRSEFEALRDAFLKSGLAYWKTERGHSQGLALTAVGKAVVRRIAHLSLETTSPQIGEGSPSSHFHA